MRHAYAVPILCFAVPIAALVSIGCGIIALPIEGPKIAAVNTKHLKFTVEIVDEFGKPLDGVEVRATRYALTPDFLFVEDNKAKPDDTKLVSGSFTYDTFGNYAVQVNYRKPGFVSKNYIYGAEDNIRIRPGAWGNTFPSSGTPIDVRKHPASRVTLTPLPPKPK